MGLPGYILPLFCLACSVMAEGAAAAPGQLPRQVHCGSLASIERIEGKCSFADLGPAFLKNAMSPQGHVPEDMRVMKAPGPGRVYAVLQFEVKQGRTLSRFDYILKSGDEKCECLGVALQPDAVYDLRRLSVEGPCRASLLFECASSAETACLLPSEGFPLMPVNGIRLLPEMAQETTGD